MGIFHRVIDVFETGAGEVTVDLRGASSLAGLTIEVGAGQLTADLTGARASGPATRSRLFDSMPNPSYS